MKRILTWFIFAALVFYAAVHCTSAGASPPTDVNVMILNVVQGSDSMAFSVAWRAPQLTGRNLPIQEYQTRIIAENGSDTLASSHVHFPTTTDTLWAPLPAIGDTVGFYAAVATVDTAGTMSAQWAVSNVKRFVINPVPPPPPDSVVTDTLPMPLAVLDVATLWPKEITLYWTGFETSAFEFVAYADSVAMACVRTQIFKPVEYDLDVFVTGGVCEEYQISNRPFTYPGGTITLDNSYWAAAVTFRLARDSAASVTDCPVEGQCWYGQIIAHIDIPLLNGSRLFQPIPYYYVQVEDVNTQ